MNAEARELYVYATTTELFATMIENVNLESI